MEKPTGAPAKFTAVLAFAQLPQSTVRETGRRRTDRIGSALADVLALVPIG